MTAAMNSTNTPMSKKPNSIIIVPSLNSQQVLFSQRKYIKRGCVFRLKLISDYIRPFGRCNKIIVFETAGELLTRRGCSVNFGRIETIAET